MTKRKNYPNLPCPECGENVKPLVYESGDYFAIWGYSCTNCTWGVDDGYDDEESAYLATCEIINRARKIPVEECLPKSVERRMATAKEGTALTACYTEHGVWVNTDDYLTIENISGWYLRPDESADLRISGDRNG